MMEVLTHEEFGSIRVIDQKYYVATDIGKALKCSNPQKAIRDHCKAILKRQVVHPQSKNNKQTVNVINEENVLRLIFSLKTVTEETKARFAEFLNLEDKFVYSSRKEIEFMSLLEPILNGFGFSLDQQKSVLNYCLDGYIPELNLVIEFDENGHAGYDQLKEKQREKEIKSELKCDFVRVTDQIPTGEALSAVIKKVLKRSA